MKHQGLTRKHVGLVWGNKKVQFLVALTGMFLGTIEYTILKPIPLIAVLDPVTLDNCINNTYYINRLC